MGTDFVPGEYWTAERAAEAVRRMVAVSEAPAMRALIEEIAHGAADGGDSAAVAASVAGAAAATRVAASIAPPSHADACVYRRGRPGDAPRFSELIVAGDLPPMFIDEFIEGFVAAEFEGSIIGCGGLEIYGDAGVIRSVVVDERARGLRIGERMSELLIEDARAAGVTDLYLFTMHAKPFWERQGFVDTPIDAWKEAPRIGWQYQFISGYPDSATGVIPMWRAASP